MIFIYVKVSNMMKYGTNTRILSKEWTEEYFAKFRAENDPSVKEAKRREKVLKSTEIYFARREREKAQQAEKKALREQKKGQIKRLKEDINVEKMVQARLGDMYDDRRLKELEIKLAKLI